MVSDFLMRALGPSRWDRRCNRRWINSRADDAACQLGPQEAGCGEGRAAVSIPPVWRTHPQGIFSTFSTQGVGTKETSGASPPSFAEPPSANFFHFFHPGAAEVGEVAKVDFTGGGNVARGMGT